MSTMRNSYYFSVVSTVARLGRVEGKHRCIAGKPLMLAIIALTLLLSGNSEAASCLNGNCHAKITAKKYLHGPVAAEQAGAQGCIACHVPAGKGCSPSKKGVYKILAPASLVCQICHTSGTGTQHSAKKIDCLKCHDPHGSDKNAQLNR